MSFAFDINALLSGVIGVLLSISFLRFQEKKREKVKVYAQFVGNRHAATGNSDDDDAKHKFIEALNKIAIYFSKKVVADYYVLYISMSNELRIQPLISEEFLTPLNLN